MNYCEELKCMKEALFEQLGKNWMLITIGTNWQFYPEFDERLNKDNYDLVATSEEGGWLDVLEAYGRLKDAKTDELTDEIQELETRFEETLGEYAERLLKNIGINAPVCKIDPKNYIDHIKTLVNKDVDYNNRNQLAAIVMTIKQLVNGEI